MYKSQYWAPCTWTLLHSLAEKASNIETIRITKHIINLVMHNLPCPFCQEHATKYYNNNLHTFLNANDNYSIKLWLFNFHNQVNKETNNYTFDISQLNKYKKYPLENVVKLWITYFSIMDNRLETSIKKNQILRTNNKVKQLLMPHLYKFNI